MWCGLEVSSHEYGRVWVFGRYVLLDPREDVFICLLLFLGVYLWHVFRYADDGGAIMWGDCGCLDIVCEVCGCWYRRDVFVHIPACC